MRRSDVKSMTECKGKPVHMSYFVSISSNKLFTYSPHQSISHRVKTHYCPFFHVALQFSLFVVVWGSWKSLSLLYNSDTLILRCTLTCGCSLKVHSLAVLRLHPATTPGCHSCPGTLGFGLSDWPKCSAHLHSVH